MSDKKHKKFTTYREVAVIWACPMCGAMNLHPLNVRDFECVNCGETYFAEAHAETEERPR